MEIAIQGLTRTYGALRALDNVDLYIAPGQIVAFLGPNGAGKTTLLRCLSGISAADSGRILFDGEVFRRDRIDLRRRFGFIPDFPFVYNEMKVLQHIGMVLRLYEAIDERTEERVLELLEMFDILPLIDSQLGKLSRGQTYKVALATMIAVDPELWLLDEPFASGMDPRGITAFRRLARDAAARGRTVIYSTQLLDLAEMFSDRVCIIYQGKVHAFDTVVQLQAERAATSGSVLEEIFDQLHENVDETQSA